MHKIALVLAIAAVGEGLLALHLVGQLHEERDNAQTLQARVTELERTSKQQAAGATFVAIPTQPAASPFANVGPTAAAQPAAPAAGNAVRVASAQFSQFSTDALAPNAQQMREQMAATLERQRTLLQDPDYREAMLSQQKMVMMRSSPDLAKDLNLTPDQMDRLFSTLADQTLRTMDTMNTWQEQPDAAKMQELQRKAAEQQLANEAELKRVLGETKYREWQEYQAMSGVRYEATRLRNSFADAGVPLDPGQMKPLTKALQEQQKLELQRLEQYVATPANATLAQTFTTPDGVNVAQLMTNSVESLAKTQQRQREALARVLTPEQLKVVEEEHNAELQMQRAQERLMRAQQAADPTLGAFTPAAPVSD